MEKEACRMVRRRTSLRLPGYDYTRPGGYYVTIVTKDRIPLFGRVVATAR